MSDLKIYEKARRLTGRKRQRWLNKLTRKDKQYLKQLETKRLINELYVIKVCDSVFRDNDCTVYILRFRNTDMMLLDRYGNIITLSTEYKKYDFNYMDVAMVVNINKKYQVRYNIAVRHNYDFDNLSVKWYINKLNGDKHNDG